MLGVKHGSLADTLGLPNEEIARRIGIGNYRRMRQRRAEEDEMFPEVVATIMAESVQEQAGAEPKLPKNKKTKKDTSKEE